MPKSVNFETYLVEAILLKDKIKDKGKYPFNIPAIKDLETLEFHPRATFFVGENGSGKSTLMEAIAVVLGINAEGGSHNFRFSTRESHSALSSALRLSRSYHKPKDLYFLRTESFFNVATEIERLDEEALGGLPIIDYYGGQSLHEQSHGESFFALFKERFFGNGLYLLDEPEAALSPSRQLAFLARMNQLIKMKSQFVISTHSPILLGYPDAWIYQFSKDGIERKAYEDTEHYGITKEFLNRRERMLEALFEEE